MSYIKQTEKEVREAYLFLRNNNHTVPSETLQFMLDASLEKLKALSIFGVGKQSELLKTFDCINDSDGFEICEHQCKRCKNVKGF